MDKDKEQELKDMLERVKSVDDLPAVIDVGVQEFLALRFHTAAVLFVLLAEQMEEVGWETAQDKCEELAVMAFLRALEVGQVTMAEVEKALLNN